VHRDALLVSESGQEAPLEEFTDQRVEAPATTTGRGAADQACVLGPIQTHADLADRHRTWICGRCRHKMRADPLEQGTVREDATHDRCLPAQHSSARNS